MLGLILDSLELKGFRAFEHLSIKQLGQVNLIVGKNNVGKSCLLEALQIYAQRASAETIRQVLTSRDEKRYPRQAHGEEAEDYTASIKYLFYGRKVFTEYPASDMFVIGPIDEINLQLVVQTQWYEEKIDPEINRKSWEPASGQLSFIEGMEDYLPGIRVAFGKELIVSSTLPRFLDKLPRYASALQRVAGIPCIFIPANSLDSKTLTKLWDNVTLKPDEERVLEGIHIIAPEVERLNLIGYERGVARIPMVKVRDISDPFPLRSLGEGVSRLFSLVLALVNAQNGLLLIDEVDSGLHYTVYPDLWRLIFQIAQRLNIQVFATTHSLDCINGFQQAVQETENESGMLVRLELRQGHIVPILFDSPRLSIVTRQELEVR